MTTNEAKFSRMTLDFSDTSDKNPMLEPARCLIYGKEKTRKTWWAGTAGKTHDVTLFNGDNNTGILRMLDQDSYLKNINNVPLGMGTNAQTMVMFLTLMFEKQQFLFDFKTQNVIATKNLKPTDMYLVCDLALCGLNDVFVFDSWSQIVKDTQVQYMRDRGLDPFEGKVTDDKNKFAWYGYANLVLDNLLNAIKSLPCHVILIAHQDHYEHEYRYKGMTQKNSVLQILSSSGTQGSKVASGFGDVLWFEHNKQATKTIIHAEPDTNRVGGGARIPPSTHEFPDWEWSNYCSEGQVPIHIPRRKPDQRKPISLMSGQEILDSKF